MGRSLDHPLSPEEHRERLELVLAGTRLGMWDWNPQTNEVAFDEQWARMLGHELSEIPFVLESWSSRVHEDDLPACFDDIRAHMEGRTEFYENVHRMRHKDGHWVHILDRGRIVQRDALGRPVRFTGTHTDITAWKEVERRALALAQGRTRFLANMSHEIRTPLHGMIGLIELLSQTELDLRQAELVRLLLGSGEHLLHLTNDILDHAKASAGQLVIDPYEFRLGCCVEESAHVFEERARSKGIDLEVRIEPEARGWVRGDGHRVRQILSNLVSNAVKFTAEGGVVLRVLRHEERIRFEVSDTGRGIEDTERIFNAYDQVDPSTAREFGGTGLGLAIVLDLVHGMAGAIEVASTPGEGTTFTVELPLPRVDREAESSAEEPEDPARGLRILVVDDHPVNQLVLQGMLALDGHEALMVGSGEAALATLASQDVDIVLMDLNMPGMGGEEALVLLRAAGVAARIVAVTGDALAETRQRCLDLGFDGFLAKPFRRSDLTRVLGSLSRAA